MIKILQRLKERWELYALLIVVGGGIIYNMWGIENRLGHKQEILTEKVSQIQMAQNKKADAELIDEKFKPIREGSKELKRQFEIMQAELRGLTVAATAGAVQRSRLLEGRLVILQNQMMAGQELTKAMVDSMNVIRCEIEKLKHLKPDTILVADTLDVDDDGSWWNPFD